MLTAGRRSLVAACLMVGVGWPGCSNKGTSSSATGGATSTATIGAATTGATGSAMTTVATTGSGGAGSKGLQAVMGTAGANGHLADPTGAAVHLHGADRAGTEYSCLYGNIFDGPSDQASIDAMKAWHINAVRVPLNEDCWLAINGIAANTSGMVYQKAIRDYVTLLESNGMYVILDLHWAAPGTQQAKGQLGMADADHAPTFWQQVATAYAGDDAKVIFNLFNEPFITDWDCWLKGGSCAVDTQNKPYTTAGMAGLLKAVRTAGADNVVILGGLGYSSDFSKWVSEVNGISTLAAPLDGLTTKNIVVSWHTYSDQSVQTLCPTQYNGYDPNLTCASGAATAKNYGMVDVLASGYPVIIGEIGIGAYSNNIAPYTNAQGQELATWLESMLTWADQQGQGYLAWDWNTQAPPVLITAFDGTPTPYFGTTYKMHLSAF